jgi:hypothetical protein
MNNTTVASQLPHPANAALQVESARRKVKAYTANKLAEAAERAAAAEKVAAAEKKVAAALRKQLKQLQVSH